MQFPSYIAGPFFMAVGFILSAVIVVGVKSVILFAGEKLKEKFSAKPSPEVKEEKKRKKRAKSPQIKSISLNTDDIDRIYFKKSS